MSTENQTYGFSPVPVLLYWVQGNDFIKHCSTAVSKWRNTDRLWQEAFVLRDLWKQYSISLCEGAEKSYSPPPQTFFSFVHCQAKRAQKHALFIL